MLPWTYLEEDRGAELARLLKAKRGFDGDVLIKEVRDAFREWKKWVAALNQLQEAKNAVSQDFGRAKRDGEQELANAFLEESKKIGNDLDAAHTLAKEWHDKAKALWAQVPNLPSQEVPEGTDESANQPIIFDYPHLNLATPPPEKPTFPFEPKDHVELGTRMGCMDFEQTARMSGARFVTLKGPLAKLERVLANWMLDFAVGLHFEEIAPPTLANEAAMFGTAQLPKFEEDLFRTTDGRYLIPTAEVTLTNLARERIYELVQTTDAINGVNTLEYHSLADGELGWVNGYVALTPCYRAEAGSAGRDTRGMMRLHEFKKVELVAICHPSMSSHIHWNMLLHSLQVLHELGLHHRAMLLCGGDMGFSAMKTYDLEVWLPSEDRYREIASISNCGDFQARRMNARFKVKGQKGTNFVHTLNGSALAVGRTLLAVMENFQTEQGGVMIPEMLRERMGGSLITHEGQII